MTAYPVIRGVESTNIKALGTSRSVMLAGLRYDKLGVGHEPYTEAFIGGLQKRSDGNMELWGKKEGSANVYVSTAFASSLIPETPGGTSKGGIILGGGYLWIEETYDSAANYAVQSLRVYNPALTQLALIDFTGSPLVRAQETPVILGFFLWSICRSKSATELWN